MKTMTQGKIVLMACGSFSPPTYMHLRMFEIAKDYIHSLGLGTVVGGIMSPVHDAYGKKDLVAAQHRISMLKMALRSSQWVKVSEWETQQAGWTRTRVSLQYHQDKINAHIRGLDIDNADPPLWLPDDILNVNDVSRDEPDRILDESDLKLSRVDSPVVVKLLCGADLLESFATPGLWSEDDMETIVGRHGLVVVTRAGSDPGRFIHESDLLHRFRKNITLVTNYIVNEVSSTVLRRLIRRGESAKYLTDDMVLSYIRQHRLYGSDSTHTVTEYGNIDEIIALYGKKSPQDITMMSPEETSFKNILISIRDRPQITDETITVKRPRKSMFLNSASHTDSVSPVNVVKNKMAYLDKVPATFVPGKAVKIVKDDKKHAIEDKQVGVEEPDFSPLDRYLKKDDNENEYEYDLYKRRVSAGHVEQTLQTEKVPIKKRCSSTIRKLNPDNEVMKKSKSEVTKLCDKVKSMKLKDGFNSKTPRNFKTRSCNDIVKLILTKHGIHVLSDTEAIV